MEVIRHDFGRISLGVADFLLCEKDEEVGQLLLIISEWIGPDDCKTSGHWSNSIEFDGQEH